MRNAAPDFISESAGHNMINIARLSHAEPLVPLLGDGQLDPFALRQRDEWLVSLQRSCQFMTQEIKAQD